MRKNGFYWAAMMAVFGLTACSGDEQSSDAKAAGNELTDSPAQVVSRSSEYNTTANFAKALAQGSAKCVSPKKLMSALEQGVYWDDTTAWTDESTGKTYKGGLWMKKVCGGGTTDIPDENVPKIIDTGTSMLNVIPDDDVPLIIKYMMSTIIDSGPACIFEIVNGTDIPDPNVPLIVGKVSNQIIDTGTSMLNVITEPTVPLIVNKCDIPEPTVPLIVGKLNMVLWKVGKPAVTTDYVFVPAAGCKDEGGVCLAGEYGFYWILKDYYICFNSKAMYLCRNASKRAYGILSLE